MRLEATVPDSLGTAVTQLAEELGTSRSQIIDEALALFLKTVVEVKRGRRLFLLDATGAQPACELASPTLSTLEWTSTTEKVDLPPEALVRIQSVVEAQAQPSERLRAAAKRQGWSKRASEG